MVIDLIFYLMNINKSFLILIDMCFIFVSIKKIVKVILY